MVLILLLLECLLLFSELLLQLRDLVVLLLEGLALRHTKRLLSLELLASCGREQQLIASVQETHGRLHHEIVAAPSASHEVLVDGILLRERRREIQRALTRRLARLQLLQGTEHVLDTMHLNLTLKFFVDRAWGPSHGAIVCMRHVLCHRIVPQIQRRLVVASPMSALTVVLKSLTALAVHARAAAAILDLPRRRPTLMPI